MKIGLFAADAVGSEVAKFFGENDEPLGCLVLDSKDASQLNSKIIETSGVTDPGEVFYSDMLYSQEVLLAIESKGLDLIILAWWPYIIKESLIQLPRLGCLNFHPSYLPYNRGKHYNFWTIVEDVPFGVTIHWVDEGVDTGDIAFQSVIEKSWEDTGETLYHKAQQEIVSLFKKHFQEIKRGNIPRKPQDLSHGSVHTSGELDEASKIKLEKKYRGRDLLNILRARTFPPYPAAWFVDGGEKYEARIRIGKIGKSGDD